MTDQPDPPTVIAFPQPPTPPPDPMQERGARLVSPPATEPPEPLEPPEKIGLFSAEMTLRDVLVEVMQGDFSNLDRAVAETLRLVDPGRKAPPFIRAAARNHLRRIAGEVARDRERPTMRPSASYAVVTYNRESQTIPSLPTPPAKARLQLNLIEAGVCNLCGKIHDEPGLFALTWTDPVLGLEIRAQFGGSCIAEAVIRDIHRREQSASLENWIRAQAKRTGRKARSRDDG